MIVSHYVSTCVFSWCTSLAAACSLSLANFSDEVVANLPEELTSGVYYGFASVSGGAVYAMVMSVGWNPTYNNEKRSMVSGCVAVYAVCSGDGCV